MLIRTTSVCALLALAACSAPQQLVLPLPGSTLGTSAIGAASRKPGVPLGDPPSAEATEPRTLMGSGEMTGSIEPRRVAAPASANDSVTLNLSNASIAAAAKAVLGDALGVSYSISDKVKGTVTIQTPRPVSRQQLSDIFETALQSEGAGILVQNGLYRIMPLDEIAATGAPIRGQGSQARGSVGYSTQVVQLKHVTALDMERVLKSVAPSSGVVRADAGRNVVLLSGTKSEIDAMVDAISVFDVDQMRGQSFGLFPIESADPEAIAQELDTIFANDRESPTKGMVRFIPNRRMKAVLVIAARPEHLRRAEGWIQKIDMVGRATEKQVHVYRVQNRPAIELVPILRRVYQLQDRSRELQTATGAGSITNGTPADGAAPPLSAALPAIAGIPGGVPQLPGLTGGGSGLPADRGDGRDGGVQAQAAVVAEPGDDRTQGIGIVADEPNNALVITATHNEYRRVRQVLSRLDVAPNQLLIEATIAEITLSDELKLGVRSFFQTGRSQFKLTDSQIGAVAPVIPGFSYFFSIPNVQVALNALSTITDVNVVSSPSLMVLDTKKAVLQIGDEVPVATQSAVSVITPGAPIVNSITFRNTGIILGITPRIGDNGRILLEIEQEVSKVTRTTTSTLDSPTIQQRRVKTTVAVNDGESLILAGLMQDDASRERAQVPFLGELPLFGNLVKNKTDTIKRTELLIAMTPRIVRDAFQARYAIDEFRGKLNFSTRPQRFGPPDRREQLERIAR